MNEKIIVQLLSRRKLIIMAGVTAVAVSISPNYVFANQHNIERKSDSHQILKMGERMKISRFD